MCDCPTPAVAGGPATAEELLDGIASAVPDLERSQQHRIALIEAVREG